MWLNTVNRKSEGLWTGQGCRRRIALGTGWSKKAAKVEDYLLTGAD